MKSEIRRIIKINKKKKVIMVKLPCILSRYCVKKDEKEKRKKKKEKNKRERKKKE